MATDNNTERMLAAAERVDNLDMRVREIEVEMAQRDTVKSDGKPLLIVLDIEEGIKRMENRLVMGRKYDTLPRGCYRNTINEVNAS